MSGDSTNYLTCDKDNLGATISFNQNKSAANLYSGSLICPSSLGEYCPSSLTLDSNNYANIISS